MFFKKENGNRFESKMSQSYKNNYLNLPVYSFDSDDNFSKYSGLSASKSFFEKKKISSKKDGGTIIFPSKFKNYLVKAKQEFTNSEVKNKYSTLKKESKKKIDDILHDNKIKKKLKWLEEGLEIKYLVKISQLRSVNLQICIWKEKINKENGNRKFFLQAECYVFLQKLFNSVTREIKQKSIKKLINYNTNLYINGKVNGEIKTKLEISHKIYLEQSVAGIMTEHGIVKFNPIIKNRLTKFNNNLDNLNSLFEKLTEKLNEKNSDFVNNKKSINSILKSLLKILTKSDNFKIRTFNYRSLKELMKAQFIFLEIGNLLLDYNEKLDTIIGKEYFECLEAILIRGEFSINNLGIETNLSKKILDMKKNNGVKYQKFIYKILNIALTEIHQKGLLEYQKLFIEFFLAYSYFRIPEFRKVLLSILSSEEYEDEIIIPNSINSHLFDWNLEFYNKIENCGSSYNANKDILKRALSKNWKIIFKKKSNIFFYFIIEWCFYVKKNLVMKNFNWENILGYNIIIKKYMEYIKTRKIKTITEICIKTGNSLLENSHNLNQFVFIIINNTNLCNQKDVLYCFFILKKWFIQYKEKEEKLPSNLDVHLLIHMTLLIFNTHHALAIANGLGFWYEFFHIFPNEIIKNFLELLIQIYFYNLFLHWSKNVRDIFNLLVCYRIIPFYEKGDKTSDNYLTKILYFINKRICIVEKSGDLYKLKIKKWKLMTKTKKRQNRILKIQAEVLESIFDLKNMLNMDIKDQLRIGGLSNFNKIRIQRKYSNKSQLDVGTNKMLKSFQEEEKTAKKFRNYKDLVHFEKINKSKLKKKHLVYCSNIVKNFKIILNKYRSEEDKVKKDLNYIPNLNFQLPFDAFEYIEDDDHIEW